MFIYLFLGFKDSRPIKVSEAGRRCVTKYQYGEVQEYVMKRPQLGTTQ
jgi:hypothetical protein